MDLLIALEMSRLQLIEDEINKQPRGKTQSMRTERNSLVTSEEAQFRLAIQLSLEEGSKQNVEVDQSEVEDASSNHDSTRRVDETKQHINNFEDEEMVGSTDSSKFGRNFFYCFP